MSMRISDSVGTKPVTDNFDKQKQGKPAKKKDENIKENAVDVSISTPKRNDAMEINEAEKLKSADDVKLSLDNIKKMLSTRGSDSVNNLKAHTNIHPDKVLELLS